MKPLPIHTASKTKLCSLGKENYLVFDKNVKYVLHKIGLSYTTFCRVLSAKGLIVNPDFPSRVANNHRNSPSINYCCIFASELDIELWRLFMPIAAFTNWFDEALEKGTYFYKGPIVRFRGLKTGDLSIDIVQGGEIALNGLKLSQGAIIKGGRVREIKNGSILVVGAYPTSALKNSMIPKSYVFSGFEKS
jgi:hypothetical protein